MVAIPANLNQLVNGIQADGRDASPVLFEALYAELRRLAGHYFKSEKRAQSLQPTALVHEAYCRLIEGNRVIWKDRAHFFGIAARVMRQVLVDHARKRATARRGGEVCRISIGEAVAGAEFNDVQVLALNEVLEKLVLLDPRKSRLIELRFFCGLSFEELAHVMNIPERTLKREWQKARAWLHTELANDHAGRIQSA